MEKKKIKGRYARVQFEPCEHITRVATEDEWDRDDTSTHWTVPDTFDIEKEYSYYSEPLNFDPVPGKDYFMVYAIWSTGDSFGHDEGAYCECFGIYQTWEEAEARRKELSEPAKGVDGYGYPSYHPWDGYFESLVSLDIKKITYTPKAQ